MLHVEANMTMTGEKREKVRLRTPYTVWMFFFCFQFGKQKEVANLTSQPPRQSFILLKCYLSSPKCIFVLASQLGSS